MNKAEFLAALAAEIRDLSREDIARSLEYYSEIIDEQVEDGMPVEEAVASLGSPEEIGQEILNALPRERSSSPDGWADRIKENIQKAMSISMEECKDAMDRAGHFANECTDQVHAHMNESGAGNQRGQGFFSSFKGRPMDSYEYRISEYFDAVDIQVGISDVRILRSAGEEALVVSKRSADTPETVEVRNGVLTVLQPLRNNTFGGRTGLFGFSFSIGSSDDSTVTVYLPERLWRGIKVSSLSGDIECEDIRSEEARFGSTSGDIEGRHIMIGGSLVMETKSGDISIKDLKGARVQLSSMSGDIEIMDGEAGSLSTDSKSGDIELENVLVSGLLRAESISGDVELHRSDAAQLDLKSSAGDIQATLLSCKDFSVRTSVGEVRVPDSVPGAGECRARSSSGDIDIRLAP